LRRTLYDNFNDGGRSLAIPGDGQKYITAIQTARAPVKVMITK
jgi:hypothetical protein